GCLSGFVVMAAATFLGAFALDGSADITPSAALPVGHATFEDGVVLVAFDRRASLRERGAAVAAVGARDTGTIGVGIHVLQVSPSEVRSAVRMLRTQRGIRHAEPDYIGHESTVDWDKAAGPSDRSFRLQWGYQNTGQTVNGLAGTPGADEDIVPAWDKTTGSRSIVIGEADSGGEYTHPDLAPNAWTDPAAIDARPPPTPAHHPP